MKRILTSAFVIAVLGTPAFARTTNVENPLFMPEGSHGYASVGFGTMFKQTDNTQALQDKGWAYQDEFPIYRGYGEFGFGILDSLAVRAKVQYTDNQEIDRRGMSDGTIGLVWRAFDGKSTDGWIVDFNADAVLGGISRLDATVIANKPGASTPLGFDYANYSHGRYGAWLGTRVGKTWDKFTGALFAQAQYTFGSTNSSIKFGGDTVTLLNGMGALASSGLVADAGAQLATMNPDFSITTKSAWEYNVGLRGFYELDEKLAFGGGFAWRSRAANVVEAVNINAGANPVVNGIVNQLKPGFMGSMHDGMNEFILSANVAYNVTETFQVVPFAEYTFASAEYRSQNGSNVKVEGGVRLNVQF